MTTIREELTIVNLYKSGWRVNEVARIVGRHPATIYKILRRNKIRLRPVTDVRKTSRLSDEGLDFTRRLYESGLSLREVGRIVGRGQQSIRHRLELAGVPLRSRGEGQRLLYQGGRRINKGKKSHRPKHLHKKRGPEGRFIP